MTSAFYLFSGSGLSRDLHLERPAVALPASFLSIYTVPPSCTSPYQDSKRSPRCLHGPLTLESSLARLCCCNWLSAFLTSCTLFWPQAPPFLWVDETFETSLAFVSLGCMTCSPCPSQVIDQPFTRAHSTGGRECLGAGDYMYLPAMRRPLRH